MTTPTQSIAVVDALGSPKTIPSFTLSGGGHVAAYAVVDPISGEAVNTIDNGFGSVSSLVATGATMYAVSESNNLAGTVAASATTSGAWEAIPKHEYLSINAQSTQPIWIQVLQSQDSTGTKLLPPFNYVMSSAFNQLIPVNGNFVRVSVTNLSATTPATYVLDSQFMSGGIPTTDSGSVAVGITELMGTNREAKNDSLIISRNSLVPGTATALTAAARVSFTATEGAIHIRNNNPVNGPDIVLKQIQLITVGAGTALTSLNALTSIDSTTRYSSGGTVHPAVSVRSGRTPSVEVRSLATLVAAPATSIQIARTTLKTGIPVVGDIFKLNYGAEFAPEYGLVSGTGASHFGHSAPPCIIPPQWNATVYMWGPAQTAAPTFEVQVVMAER